MDKETAVTELENAESDLQHARELIENLEQTVNEALTALDKSDATMDDATQDELHELVSDAAVRIHMEVDFITEAVHSAQYSAECAVDEVPAS